MWSLKGKIIVIKSSLPDWNMHWLYYLVSNYCDTEKVKIKKNIKLNVIKIILVLQV